jgi:hypothetical protein
MFNHPLLIYFCLPSSTRVELAGRNWKGISYTTSTFLHLTSPIPRSFFWPLLINSLIFSAPMSLFLIETPGFYLPFLCSTDIYQVNLCAKIITKKFTSLLSDKRDTDVQRKASNGDTCDQRTGMGTMTGHGVAVFLKRHQLNQDLRVRAFNRQKSKK